MSETWNADKQAYADCEGCQGKGWFDNGAVIVEPCNVCLPRRIADLEAQLEAHYQRLYNAMQPFVAGGSEYTEWSGIERGIRTIGERMQSADQRAIHEVKRRKEAERQRDDLAVALRPFAEAIVYLPDDVADTRTLWAEVALGHYLCLMVATARDIRNAAKALSGLEGENNATARRSSN